VVYKVDRLSRSLLDFARVMETFDKNKVAFVSVTQQFNTASSMGRLILNALLSFAQFEREIVSERTRDKIAAARRKGKWSGGMPLFGYDLAGGKLAVNGPVLQFKCWRPPAFERRARPTRPHSCRSSTTGRGPKGGSPLCTSSAPAWPTRLAAGRDERRNTTRSRIPRPPENQRSGAQDV
jgi:Resolvase, N terminal domain